MNTKHRFIDSKDWSMNRIGTPQERVTFPILPNIEETNGVEWGEDKLNEIQRLSGNVAITESMNNRGTGDVGEGLI